MNEPVGCFPPGLYARLDDIGLLQFHTSFGDGNLRIDDWRLALGDQPELLQLAIRFFLLAESIETADLRKVIDDTHIEALCASGIITEGESGITLAPYRLTVFRRLVLFYELGMDPSTYFGDDSVALGTYMTPPPGGTSALDLCAGSGVQAMLSARCLGRATGVEINPTAAKLARINVCMNGMDGRVEIVNQDFNDFFRTSTELRDLVTFNPPLLPVPQDLGFPFVGGGGDDGLALTKAIVLQSQHLLTRRGLIQFVGTGLGKDSVATFVSDLETLGRQTCLEVRVHLLSKQQLKNGGALFDGIVASASHCSQIPYADAEQRIAKHYAALDANELYLFFCSMRRGTGGGVRVIDTATQFYGGWFV